MSITIEELYEKEVARSFRYRAKYAAIKASHAKLKTVAHNLAETMGIDYAIKFLSVSDDTMAVGASALLKGIQVQAKQALAEAEKIK